VHVIELFVFTTFSIALLELLFCVKYLSFETFMFAVMNNSLSPFGFNCKNILCCLSELQVTSFSIPIIIKDIR